MSDAKSPRRHLLPAARFASAQRRHFLLSVALPTAVALSGPFWLPGFGSSWQWWALAIFMWWVVGCWGITVGFHRLFAHRSFAAPDAVRYALGAMGSMAAQGSVIYWVALHRAHHTFSDQEGDPHSPALSARPGMSPVRAFLQGHMLWARHHDVPKPTRFAAELLRDPVAVVLAQQYGAWAMVGILAPALLACVFAGWSIESAVLGAYWGGFVRIAVGHQLIWCINSVCHHFGRRPHPTRDTATNVAWLSIPTWGESWHNNHHAHPTSARLGLAWYQIDLGWWCVWALCATRLAKLNHRTHSPAVPCPFMSHKENHHE